MANRTILVSSPPPKKGSALKWILIGGGVLVVFLLLVVSVGVIVGSVSYEKVALIRVSGAIGGGGSFLAPAADPDDVMRMLQQAENDPSVKGILLEINSPGGSAVASEEVMKAVLASEKPTVAVIRDIGTSGAYWIASGADYIIASPVSITGSVGVTSAYLEFSEFLEGHGVSYERLVAGRYKDIGSPFRNLTDDERSILQDALSEMHDYFLDSVKENRQIDDPVAIDRIATALIFLGSEGKELGLVDELGGKKEAEEWLMEETGIAEINYISYERKSLFGISSLISEQSAQAGSAFGRSVIAGLLSANSFQDFGT